MGGLNRGIAEDGEEERKRKRNQGWEITRT